MVNYSETRRPGGGRRYSNGYGNRDRDMELEQSEKKKKHMWFCGLVHVKALLVLIAVYLLACISKLISMNPRMQTTLSPLDDSPLPLFALAVFFLISVGLAIYGLHVSDVVQTTGCRYRRSGNFPPFILLVPSSAATVLLLVPFVKLSYDSLSGLWYHLESDLPRKVLPSPGAVILVMFALAVCWLLAVYVVCGAMSVFGFVCEQSACWAEKIPRSALLMSLQKVNVETSNGSLDGGSRSMFRRVDRNDTTAAQRMKATLVNVKYEVNNDGAGDYQRDDEGADPNARRSSRHRSGGQQPQRDAPRFSPMYAPTPMSSSNGVSRGAQLDTVVEEGDLEIASSHRRYKKTTAPRSGSDRPIDIFHLTG